MSSAVQSEAVTLKDGSDATIFYLKNKDEVHFVPEKILLEMKNAYDYVIEEGQTYPYLEPSQSLEDFKNIWMQYACAIMVAGKHDSLNTAEKFLGTYYVKPNYAGRCSHVSNAGFLVSTSSRGQGIGKVLGRSYVKWAPTLGYTYSVFNLVFKTNVASWSIWESLGFDRIGIIPGAARLKGYDEPVDAYMYGKALI